jgi:hypothetical protein
VLVAHHLPELGPDLVPALPALDVEDLPHLRLAKGALPNLRKIREMLLQICGETAPQIASKSKQINRRK